MKDKILSYVKEHGNVSFAELERLLGDVAHGDQAIGPAENKTLLYWGGMSAEFVDAVGELLDTGQLVMKPASFLVYLVDSSIVSLPVAKSNRQYKKPHWMPIVFDAKPCV